MSDIAFKYFLPVNIEFGSGKVAKAGELTKPYGKKALIVTGHSSCLLYTSGYSCATCAPLPR